jgi:hypothetical protein
MERREVQEMKRNTEYTISVTPEELMEFIRSKDPSVPEDADIVFSGRDGYSVGVVCAVRVSWGTEETVA